MYSVITSYTDLFIGITDSLPRFLYILNSPLLKLKDEILSCCSSERRSPYVTNSISIALSLLLVFCQNSCSFLVRPFPVVTASSIIMTSSSCNALISRSPALGTLIGSKPSVIFFSSNPSL